MAGGLTPYDIKVIREEGEDTRRELERVRKELKDSNKILSDILVQLMLLVDQGKPRKRIGPM